jgi:hypothetical protein
VLTVTPQAEGSATISVTATDGELTASDDFVVTVQAGQEASHTISVERGWNLVSVSIEAVDMTPAALLPDCPAAFVFDPETGYTTLDGSDVLPTATGLFAFCTEAATYTIEGTASSSGTFAVKRGWNLVSPREADVAVTSDAIGNVDPDGVIASPFFAFDRVNGYAQASVLQPGRAYWVFARAEGTLLMRPSATALPASAARPAATSPADVSVPTETSTPPRHRPPSPGQQR